MYSQPLAVCFVTLTRIERDRVGTIYHIGNTIESTVFLCSIGFGFGGPLIQLFSIFHYISHYYTNIICTFIIYISCYRTNHIEHYGGKTVWQVPNIMLSCYEYNINQTDLKWKNWSSGRRIYDLTISSTESWGRGNPWHVFRVLVIEGCKFQIVWHEYK